MTLCVREGRSKDVSYAAARPAPGQRRRPPVVLQRAANRTSRTDALEVPAERVLPRAPLPDVLDADAVDGRAGLCARGRRVAHEADKDDAGAVEVGGERLGRDGVALRVGLTFYSGARGRARDKGGSARSAATRSRWAEMEG